MASKGLGQIDENSSFVQTSGNDQPLLPNLLRRQMPLPQPENVGEKTPEIWSSPYGEAPSPSAVWPSTPTPHAVSIRPWNGFSIGDGSSEPWPACPPSSQIDPQQASNTIGMPVMMQVSGTGAPIVPMWTSQAGFPGMAFPGNMPNMVNFGIPAQALPLAMNSNTHPAREPIEKRASEGKVTMGNKRAPAVIKPKSGESEPACPVAVYVDLSALKERGSGIGRGLSNRR